MTDQAPDLHAFNYCISFIDLLGQRDALKDQGLLPSFGSETERDQFFQTIRDSIGSISALQDRSDAMMEASARQSPFCDSLSLEHQCVWDEMLKTKVSNQTWSDGLVSFVSLGNQEIKCPMNGIYNIIAHAGSLCFIGLASKRPLRGAVEIAWGVELRPGELYGAAVARAYELESEVAQYPRIVVSDRTIGYLLHHINNPEKDVFAENNRDIAKLCHSMLIKDTDGVAIVHYLGEKFQQAITQKQHPFLFIEAKNFILEQLATYNATKNTKLAFRYVNLLNYFEAHPVS